MFELKSRDDHRPREGDDAAYDLKGEVNQCQWSSITEKCEAGKTLVICPEENVVETSLTQKAHGTCAQDAFTCPSGEKVSRDPVLSCRFASCPGQTSLVEMTNAQPTYKWNGVSVSSDQNFCSRMTGILGSSEDKGVADCGALAVDVCEDHYVHVLDGKVGDIEHCEVDGSACAAGALHNCTWSFYMKDLITKHDGSTQHC